MTTSFQVKVGDYTQDNRNIKIETSLGKDVFLLSSFNGTEAISELFHFKLELLSARGDIVAKDIVGDKVDIEIGSQEDEPQLFNGYVQSLIQVGQKSKRLFRYQITIVPWLWFLTKSSNNRIFQNKSATDILEEVFNTLGFTDYTFSALQGKCPVIEYCVQYQETDFNFVSRLMEKEGIFYHFDQSKGKHKLVLGNYTNAYKPLKNSTLKHCVGTHSEPHIFDWQHQFHFCSTHFSQDDFDFENCESALNTQSSSTLEFKNDTKLEQYHYPGQYNKFARGNDLTQWKMQQEESKHDIIVGRSNVFELSACNKFTLLSNHEVDNDKKFVVTKIHHSIVEGSDIENGSDNASPYENRFECIPATVTYRPPANYQKPLIVGTQTAIVTGSVDSEIHTDKYGRVKLQFHWDRHGKKNENSSCWVRVASQWAGKKWGAISTPRVGQEVVVTFVNGDPDRPLIIGSVYNSVHLPPYDLPAKKTQSGIKTHSSKDGTTSNFNEIRFEDKKGSEELFIQAEKDNNNTIKNDQNSTIGNDQFTSVSKNQTIDIGNDRSVSVAKNQNTSIQGNNNLSVTKNDSTTVSGDRSMSVSGSHSEDISKNQSISIGKDLTITINGDEMITVNKDLNETTNGKHIQIVKKEFSLKAKKVQITADDEISFSTGSAQIIMKKKGDIIIKGKKITVKGSGDIVLKGSKISEN